MISHITIIHNEWKDIVTLDFNTNRLNRIKINDEYANFTLNKNKLFVNWDKWDNEVFISLKNDNIYYIVEEVNFIHNDWTDICYIDHINNIIYRKINDIKGTFSYINNELVVSWIEINRRDELHTQKIPNILHFIYGFKEQNEEFELYKYLSIKSAHDLNKPDKIYFYYYNEPFGYWWNKIKEYLTLIKVIPPTEIYGNKLYHYAHQADVIRLQKLIEHGGIYLDIDTICLKSFSDLLHYDFVMGRQTNCDNTDTYGLCNAVVLSAPNSEFAQKWLETYKTFRSTGRDFYWDEHSVLKPLLLSNIYKDNIKILDHNSFFYPLWYDIHKILFSETYDINEYKNIIKNNYCIHLWDTYSHDYLKTLNENFIFEHHTLYNLFSRKFLRNKISILMLTYNRLEKTIHCLESYLKCLDNDYIEEMIILDNNSNNDLIEYLKKFQENHEKIKLIFLSENLGVCGGRSILFKEAIGDIIISLDCDAYLIHNSFFDKIISLLYDEKYGIIGISGAFIKNLDFGSQEDIDDKDENEYIVDHIAGCCQAFRRDLFHLGFGLDPFYGKFWVEDTDLSMQSLELNKKNYRFCQKNYMQHQWGGSGKNFQDLFQKNWDYFKNKWKNRFLMKNL